VETINGFYLVAALLLTAASTLVIAETKKAGYAVLIVILTVASFYPLSQEAKTYWMLIPMTATAIFFIPFAYRMTSRSRRDEPIKSAKEFFSYIGVGAFSTTVIGFCISVFLILSAVLTDKLDIVEWLYPEIKEKFTWIYDDVDVNISSFGMSILWIYIFALGSSFLGAIRGYSRRIDDIPKGKFNIHWNGFAMLWYRASYTFFGLRTKACFLVEKPVYVPDSLNACPWLRWMTFYFPFTLMLSILGWLGVILIILLATVCGIFWGLWTNRFPRLIKGWIHLGDFFYNGPEFYKFPTIGKKKRRPVTWLFRLSLTAFLIWLILPGGYETIPEVVASIPTTTSEFVTETVPEKVTGAAISIGELGENVAEIDLTSPKSQENLKIGTFVAAILLTIMTLVILTAKAADPETILGALWRSLYHNALCPQLNIIGRPTASFMPRPSKEEQDNRRIGTFKVSLVDSNNRVISDIKVGAVFHDPNLNDKGNGYGIGPQFGHHGDYHLAVTPNTRDKPFDIFVHGDILEVEDGLLLTVGESVTVIVQMDVTSMRIKPEPEDNAE